MVIYNIQTNGASSQLVIELMNDAVFLEPSSIAYVLGNLELDASGGGTRNHLLAFFIGKNFFKPSYKGTGKIYLKPTLGTYHKFALQADEELIIADQAFIACRDSMHVIPKINISLAKFLSGIPMVNSVVRGAGNLVLHMPGPTVELKLQEDKFVAYNHNIAAYSPGLQVTRQQAGHGWLTVAYRMVRIFRGSGMIYFCPHPNKGTND